MSVAFTDTSRWEARAACRGVVATSFVPPVSGESPAARDRRERAAKRICEQCPVRRECLDYALRVREPFGIWGGLNEPERRRVGAAHA